VEWGNCSFEEHVWELTGDNRRLGKVFKSMLINSCDSSLQQLADYNCLQFWFGLLGFLLTFELDHKNPENNSGLIPSSFLINFLLPHVLLLIYNPRDLPMH